MALKILKLNLVTREVTFPGGEILRVKKINPILLLRVQQNREGEPKPPIVEVELAGRKTKQPNKADPEYLEAHQTWQNERNRRAMDFVFTAGVATEAPLEFIEEMRPFIGADTTNAEWRCIYAQSLCDSEDLINEMFEAITGQSIATDEGIAEATEDAFQGDGERDGREGIHLQPIGDDLRADLLPATADEGSAGDGTDV